MAYGNCARSREIENVFLFRKQQSSKNVEGIGMYVKHTASSSSLLTRLGLMQTSSPRNFNAVITLAMARRCSCAIFFQGMASSQFTVHNFRSLQHYSREIREEAILTQMGNAGPGSASLGMSPRRHEFRLWQDSLIRGGGGRTLGSCVRSTH